MSESAHEPDQDADQDLDHDQDSEPASTPDGAAGTRTSGEDVDQDAGAATEPPD